MLARLHSPAEPGKSNIQKCSREEKMPAAQTSTEKRARNRSSESLFLKSGRRRDLPAGRVRYREEIAQGRRSPSPSGDVSGCKPAKRLRRIASQMPWC